MSAKTRRSTWSQNFYCSRVEDWTGSSQVVFTAGTFIGHIILIPIHRRTSFQHCSRFPTLACFLQHLEQDGRFKTLKRVMFDFQDALS